MSAFYLTTPIYYPNARPHVGSAYTTIVCDVIARYKRMCGYDVAFLTGTDEHGEKLQRAADAAGVPVERFVAEKRELFTALWRRLGISDYRFVHTSQNPAHREAVWWMIRQAQRAGYIEKKKYEGRYCIFDERYVSDSTDPVNCDICGRPAELISEENYFFKLSAFQDRLLNLYGEHREFVQPDFRMNEVKSFVKGGLRDISISRRRLKWGIPWPGDDEQVVYVWYDALTSYLTGIGFEGEKRSKDFEKYWMGADGPTEVVHMIGKDILRFHAVYWPAFLMAANDPLPEAEKLPLPKTIFAHGWIYYEQDKMSKSKGNVVYPEPIVGGLDFFGAPGNDALRYYLLREAPFGQDTSFSYEALIQRYNSDLANDVGNLANRTLTLLQSRFGGRIPTTSGSNPSGSEGELHEAELHAFASGLTLPEDSDRRLDRCDFSGFLEVIWHHVANENRYFTVAHPWANDDAEQVATVLRHAAQALRKVAALTYPVLPLAAPTLWQQLGEGQPLDGVRRGEPLTWEEFPDGAVVGKPVPIFPRLDKAKTLAKLHELAEADRERSQPKGATVTVSSEMPQSANPSSQPLTPAPRPLIPEKITINDFAKIDLRVGQILSAESIPGAKKLLKVMVDIGTEVRQVCAGIAEYYQPEQLVGMKVVLVANLEPRKLRGVESNGMIVAASVGDDGRPVLATFNEEVPNGARLK
ncbi:MAG TPA: methionine--tRNA ligase [Terriglobia bacterium]|nr:methionine--tRNA ligase [Terriglobia bacterium]